MKKKYFVILSTALACLGTMTIAFAEVVKGMSGIGAVASQAKSSLGAIAEFITAASYVGGMGFAVGAIATFKAHKDTPTQVPVSKPIVL